MPKLTGESESLLRHRDQIVVSVLGTSTIGGVAYGSMWSAGWNGAAWAGLTLFASIWLAVLYLVWFVK